MYARTALRKRLPMATALAACALLALPASGMAAETFGSRLKNEPTDGGCKTPATPPCTYVSYIHPSDPNGDPYSGGAPKDGVITKFRIRAFVPDGESPSVTFRLANINLQDINTGLATDAGTGPTVNVAGTGEIEEFPGRLPVKKGNHLALDTSNVNAIYNSNGSKFTYVYSPPLVAGQGPRGSNDVTNELLVAAVVEPDADKDGFGDETQDQCLGNGSDATAPCAKPAGKPALSGLSVATTATGAHKLIYRLSAAAKVAVKLQKAAKGRKVRGKCRKQTAANANRKRCTRWVGVRKLQRNGIAGLNDLKVASRKLSAGRYRLVLTAKNSAGTTTKRIGFRVKR